MTKPRKYLRDLIPININRLVLYDGSFEYHFDGNTLSLVPESFGKRCFLAVFINGIRQQMSWDLYERRHAGRLKNAVIGHRYDVVYYVVSGGRRFRHLFLCSETNRLGTRVDFFPDHNRAYERGKARDESKTFREQCKEMEELLFPEARDEIARWDEDYKRIRKRSSLDF
jgi:hypothetical protein